MGFLTVFENVFLPFVTKSWEHFTSFVTKGLVTNDGIDRLRKGNELRRPYSQTLPSLYIIWSGEKEIATRLAIAPVFLVLFRKGA